MAFLAPLFGAAAAGGGGAAAGGLAAATVAEGATIGASMVGAGGAMGAGMAAAEAAGTGLFAAGGSALVGGAAAGGLSLGTVANSMQGAGTVTNMLGTMMQAEAVAGNAENAANLARLNAAEVVKEGAKKEKTAEGLQRIAYAKGGVVTNTGSPLLVMADTIEKIHLETMRERAKWLLQADQLEDSADEAKQGGIIGTLTKGLGGFGTILGNIIKKDPTFALESKTGIGLGSLFGR